MNDWARNKRIRERGLRPQHGQGGQILERIQFRVEEITYGELLAIMEKDYNVSEDGLKTLLHQAAGIEITGKQQPLWFVVNSQTIEKYQERGVEPTMSQLAGSSVAWSDVGRDEAAQKYKDLMQ